MNVYRICAIFLYENARKAKKIYLKKNQTRICPVCVFNVCPRAVVRVRLTDMCNALQDNTRGHVASYTSHIRPTALRTVLPFVCEKSRCNRTTRCQYNKMYK